MTGVQTCALPISEIVILLGLTLAVLVARPFIMHYRLHERVAGLVTAFLRLDI